MTIDAIIMMIITLVGYIGGFSYFMIRVFKKEKRKSKKQGNKWRSDKGQESELDDVLIEMNTYRKGPEPGSCQE